MILKSNFEVNSFKLRSTLQSMSGQVLLSNEVVTHLEYYWTLIGNQVVSYWLSFCDSYVRETSAVK